MPLRCADPGVGWGALMEPPSLTDDYLRPLLTCLVQFNLIWLRDHNAPPLYSAGVVYVAEAPGNEHWRSIPHVLRLGYADCKSLAAWRVAELQTRGEDAKCRFTSKATPTGRLWHIFVVRENGREEDPSRLLGMKV